MGVVGMGEDVAEFNVVTLVGGHGDGNEIQ